MLLAWPKGPAFVQSLFSQHPHRVVIGGITKVPNLRIRDANFQVQVVSYCSFYEYMLLSGMGNMR